MRQRKAFITKQREIQGDIRQCRNRAAHATQRLQSLQVGGVSCYAQCTVDPPAHRRLCMQSVRARKMQMAGSMREGRVPLKALSVVDKMRAENRLRGRVYGPVVLEVTARATGGVSAQQAAVLLDRVLPTWLRWAFVFTHREDERMVQRALQGDAMRLSTVLVEKVTAMKRIDVSHIAGDGAVGTADAVRVRVLAACACALCDTAACVLRAAL